VTILDRRNQPSTPQNFLLIPLIRQTAVLALIKYSSHRHRKRQAEGDGAGGLDNESLEIVIDLRPSSDLFFELLLGATTL